MHDILEAVLTFLAALALGALAQGLCLLSGKGMAEAGAVGTAALVVSGLAICHARARAKWAKEGRTKSG